MLQQFADDFLPMLQLKPAPTISRQLGLFSLLLVSIVSLLFSSPKAEAQDSVQPLPTAIEQLLKQSGLPRTALHLSVIPTRQGDAVIAFQETEPVSPASTMKLVTTQAALDLLGPQFRWKTQLLSSVPVVKERLKGDLIIKGGGDPDLTWEKFASILRQLRQQGLRDIHGDILLDRSYFQPQRPELNAPAFDDNPDAYYNVIPDALLIHSNLTAINLSADQERIQTQLLTPSSNITLRPQLKLNNAPCNQWKNGWRSPQIKISEDAYSDAAGHIEINLQGSFPRSCQTTVYLNLLERNAYIAKLFRALWTELGGTWKGKIRDGSVPENALPLLTHESATLADTLKIVNKASDNVMARIVFMTLAAESKFETAADQTNPDSALRASQLVRQWLEQQGIDAKGFAIENGSGLSRTDRISTQQLAQILRRAAQSNWYPEFATSLPIVGIDGTMHKRLKDSVAQARSRIKTGYLKNAIAIAGFVRDTQGNDMIVVAILNAEDLTVAQGKPLLDGIIAWLANGR
ncbi:MAG: D-alanyl-D-alanine carboxypeptidase/D-alanyl-D-alanine-endopeptidase [Burkholderiales bacterium]|nr:D-alanyl-D-alanine carboxypeptidase/D-alanyl-D-alanine-endopeptidase [Burkholderiales bacterium]